MAAGGWLPPRMGFSWVMKMASVWFIHMEGLSWRCQQVDLHRAEVQQLLMSCLWIYESWAPHSRQIDSACLTEELTPREEKSVLPFLLACETVGSGVLFQFDALPDSVAHIIPVVEPWLAEWQRKQLISRQPAFSLDLITGFPWSLLAVNFLVSALCNKAMWIASRILVWKPFFG